MTDIELLPLPAEDYVDDEGLWEKRHGPYSHEQMEDYARANVAHATAPLQAEIEALRAENKGHGIAIQQLCDRAERLAEALRRQRDWWLASKGEAVSSAPGGLTRIDPGFIALCDAHVQQIDLALRDHDQEGDHEQNI